MSQTSESTDTITAASLVETMHLGLVAAALERMGIFAALRDASSANQLAERFEVDREILTGTLEFLSRRTGLVERERDGYRLGPDYDAHARFLLELYGGAFVPNALKLESVLKAPNEAFEHVDRAAQARAFAQAPQQSAATIAGLIQQLEINHLLDLGCGSGLLLASLAEQIPEFVGWGVDFNEDMCRAARQRIDEVTGTHNVRIGIGSVQDLDGLLSDEDRQAVQAIYAGDILNEMFHGGGSLAIKWLRTLRTIYPGRTFVVSDYYGRLNSQEPADDSLLLLHDFSQLISGQGIPPPDAEGWIALYEAAGCRFVHAIEDNKSSRFLHIVQL